MVDVKVAEKQECRLSAIQVIRGPTEAVSGVEQDVVPLGLHEGADRVSGFRVVPAVRAQKDHLHFFRPLHEFS